MSHFYGSMQGSRRETTRCGDMRSGIRAHVRGWNLGVMARMHNDSVSDVATVSLSGGSNGNVSGLYLGEFIVEGNQVIPESGPLVDMASALSLAMELIDEHVPFPEKTNSMVTFVRDVYEKYRKVL